MDFSTNIFTIFQRGGYFMYPILLSLILGLGIFLMKMRSLRLKKAIPDDFLKHLYRLLSQGRLSEAQVYSRANDSPIARVATAATENADREKYELYEEIEEAEEKESYGFLRNIEGLGAISNAATLLGLMGTISGMTKIFDVISGKTSVNPSDLSGGVHEALYATGFGLLVAILAFIAYKYTAGKADDLISLMEEEGRKMLEYITTAKKRNLERKDEAREITI